jgi:hydrogenase maturation protease
LRLLDRPLSSGGRWSLYEDFKPAGVLAAAFLPVSASYFKLFSDFDRDRRLGGCKVLLLGLGNDLLTDDAVGLRVAYEVRQRLTDHQSIAVTETAEMGLALLDLVVGYETLIIVDAIQTNIAPPGFVHELEGADLNHLPAVSPHFLGIGELLALGRELGLTVPTRVKIFAIETQDPFTVGTQMTPQLKAALPLIVDQVLAFCEHGANSGPIPPGSEFLALKLLRSRQGLQRSVAAGDGQSSTEKPVAGDHAVGVMGVDSFAPEFASRAFEDQSAGGNVPNADATFDVRIESAGGDIGQGERRRAHDAHFANAVNQFDKVGQGGFEALFGFRKPNGHDGLVEFATLANIDDLAVKPRGTTTDGCPGFIAKGVIDDAHNRLVSVFVDRWTWIGRAVLQGNGYARMGYGVGKVDGSIDRVDYPAILGIGLPDDAFLAEERDMRKPGTK